MWERLNTFCCFIFLSFFSHQQPVIALTLITFDVDGTLVSGSGKKADASAHSRAFGYAVEMVLGDGNPAQAKLVGDVLPKELYHGSTDGLILLRLARATLGIEPNESNPRLDEMMNIMYGYINDMQDTEIARGINPLPGVIDALSTLANHKETISCGLVTGNVEGIARRKMKAVGVLDTKALSDPCPDQLKRNWQGTNHLAFLGGFGSDYCSGNIDDDDRNYLDRAEQIAIAVRRCQNVTGQELRRVIHVGDAPADVLAAKSYSKIAGKDICVGLVGLATGSYSSEQLKELAGESFPGRWEPIILDGMDDPAFLRACGID